MLIVYNVYNYTFPKINPLKLLVKLNSLYGINFHIVEVNFRKQFTYCGQLFLRRINFKLLYEFILCSYGGVCITASRNILTSGNISLKLFMAPL